MTNSEIIYLTFENLKYVSRKISLFWSYYVTAIIKRIRLVLNFQQVLCIYKDVALKLDFCGNIEYFTLIHVMIYVMKVSQRLNYIKFEVNLGKN